VQALGEVTRVAHPTLQMRWELGCLRMEPDKVDIADRLATVNQVGQEAFVAEEQQSFAQVFCLLDGQPKISLVRKVTRGFGQIGMPVRSHIVLDQVAGVRSLMRRLAPVEVVQ